MMVLVTHESGDRDTSDIAQRITVRLRSHGLDVRLAPFTAVAEVEAYDGIVIGGHTARSHWPRAARRFVRQHEEELARRPVWLFSSARGGTPPSEFDAYERLLEPEDEVVLPGASDRPRVETWADAIAERLDQLHRDRAIDAIHRVSDREPSER